jgi:predicted transcriptional regulator
VKKKEMVKPLTIQTLHPIKKSGVVMHEKIYEMVLDFILDAAHQERELTMMRLLEMANLNFPDPLEGNLAWHLYHVKLDLEARGLLKIKMIERDNRQRAQILLLTRKGKERFQQRGIMGSIAS